MPNDATFYYRFRVHQAEIDGTPGILFERWLPVGDENSIVVEEGNRRLEIRFDDQPFNHDSVPPLEDVKRRPCANVCNLACTVKVSSIDDEVFRGLRTWTSEEDRAVFKQFGSASSENPHFQFAAELTEWVVDKVNRLIRFARDETGQWWLEEQYFDRFNLQSLFFGTHAQFRIDDSKAVQWQPPGSGGQFTALSQRETAVKREDWERVKAFVTSQSNTSIVAHYLADAERLNHEERYRHALISAAIALEAGIRRFVENPGSCAAAGDILKRTRMKSLPALYKKVGLRGTVAVILPLLFDEATLPHDVVDSCCDAVDTRNLIIHNSKREISRGEVRKHLAAIRAVCQLIRGDN